MYAALGRRILLPASRRFEGDPMATTDATTTGERALPGLEEKFEGPIIRPGDPHYAASRALWNGLIDHHPAVIAQATNGDDVAAALLRGRDAGLEIAVRCGGHSHAGHSMSQGGLTIDLSGMNQVEVDPVACTAKVGGGALLMDVAKAGEPHGLAMPFGTISHTGVAGFTLGGGIGWVMRKYGLALDRVRSLRLVSAEGKQVTASDSENPDLFWALRGGGGNFGIVTEFEFELCPYGPQSLSGLVFHRYEDAADVMRFSRDFMETAPEELTVFEAFLTVPPQDPFPSELQGKLAFALGMSYVGPIEEAEKVVRPLREYGKPAGDLVGPMPTTAFGSLLDDSAPHGIHTHDRGHWLPALPDDAIETLVEQFADVPSPMSLLLNARVSGAVERVPQEATAFGHRDCHRLLWIIGQWFEGDYDEQHAWTERVYEAMKPFSSGAVYVNALADEGEERIRAAYKNDIWKGLVEAKRRWDPDNVFRLNQNIRPDAS
jgi:FAD/FMN-containing dehydrogenase